MEDAGQKIRKKESSEEEPVKKEPVRKSVSGKKSLSKTQIKGLETELQRTGVAMEAVRQRYHVDDPLQMSEETYYRVMNALSRTKSADVA